MDKYIIDSDTLTGLANTLREVTGEDRTYTPSEMIEAVSTILDSATYILVDEDGNEIPAVFVDNETIFDATANDIRLGKIAATAEGVTEGTKEIPAYHTSFGWKIVTAGSKFILPMNDYDYTELQVIICPFNTSMADSVATEKVVIDGVVYSAQSVEAESVVTVDVDNERVDLGITNDSDKSYILRYSSYKEIY